MNQSSIGISHDIIDLKAMQNLQDLDEDGSDGIIKQLVQMYGDALPYRVRALEENARAGDLKQVAIAAHAFKSPSANLGIRRVVALLQQIEDGDYRIDELGMLIQQVAMEANRAKNILERRFSFGTQSS